jgi:hypothetical protein
MVMDIMGMVLMGMIYNVSLCQARIRDNIGIMGPHIL